MRRGAGCAIGIGLLLLAVSAGGVIWLVDSVRRVTSDSQIEGVIVDLIESRDSDGSLVYAPVVEYTVEGVAYRIQSGVNYGGLAVPDVGEIRTVFYDPDDPRDATFRSAWTLWIIPGLLTALPVMIVVAMIGFAVYNRRRDRDQPPPIEWLPSQVGDDELDTAIIFAKGGEEIVADFMGAEVSPMDAAGRMQYRVRAQAEVDQVIRRFEGPWVDDDPTLEYMRAGNRVIVRIDPDDPERYRVVGPAGQ